jgi:hypothetical protein
MLVPSIVEGENSVEDKEDAGHATDKDKPMVHQEGVGEEETGEVGTENGAQVAHAGGSSVQGSRNPCKRATVEDELEEEGPSPHPVTENDLGPGVVLHITDPATQQHPSVPPLNVPQGNNLHRMDPTDLRYENANNDIGMCRNSGK